MAGSHKKRKFETRSGTRSSRELGQKAREPFEGWPKTVVSPGGSELTIFFHGLLSFCYDPQQNHCEVGAYSPSKHHDFQIEIVRPGFPNETFDRNKLKETGHTLAQTSSLGPLFYMPKPFDRNASTPPDPQDFRWMLDIEGSDVFGKVVPGKKRNFYQPKISIKAGTFYTCEKTVSKFSKVDLVSGDDISLSNIAFCMAANIKLGGGDAALTLVLKNNSPKTFTFSAGNGPYKIFVDNVCKKNDKVCTRNDYFHHFASFDPPVGENPVMIALENAVQAPHRCGRDVAVLTTDEAPCGGAGYGGTSGMPPP